MAAACAVQAARERNTGEAEKVCLSQAKNKIRHDQEKSDGIVFSNADIMLNVARRDVCFLTRALRIAVSINHHGCNFG